MDNGSSGASAETWPDKILNARYRNTRSDRPAGSIYSQNLRPRPLERNSPHFSSQLLVNELLGPFHEGHPAGFVDRHCINSVARFQQDPSAPILLTLLRAPVRQVYTFVILPKRQKIVLCRREHERRRRLSQSGPN